MPDSSITKKALAAAIKELMAERPLNKISVGDICEQCSMNRKSFYYHFKDKYDLVNWVFYTEFVEQLMQEGMESPWGFLQSICTYFYDNRAFYVNALEQTGQNSFSEYFAEVMRPILQIHYTDLLDEDDDAHDFYATFYTDAFLTAIKRWLREDSMPPVKCTDYTFSQLKSTVLNKDGDTVTATVAVEYLDSVTKMMQISQFELVLKLVDGNWKIIG